MAQTENGVGISYKLPDGTMVWTRRDTWAEVREDISLIFGDAAVARVEGMLQNAWSNGKNEQAALSLVKQTLGASEEPASAQQENQEFETCPRCGATKNRWVPPGVSKTTGKRYPGFWACPTAGCPGR